MLLTQLSLEQKSFSEVAPEWTERRRGGDTGR